MGYEVFDVFCCLYKTWCLQYNGHNRLQPIYLQITSKHTQILQLCVHMKNILGRARKTSDPWIAVLNNLTAV